MPDNNLGALILAAGKGERFGEPKIKFFDGEDFFLNRIVKNLHLSGITNITIVIRKEEIQWVTENFKNLEIIVNENPEKGMSHSIELGFSKMSKYDGIIVFPVDHPYVKTDTVTSLINKFSEDSNSIIKPVYEKKSGHPIIVPKDFVSDYKEFEGLNMNEKIISSSIKSNSILTNDFGILKNINRKNDLPNSIS